MSQIGGSYGSNKRQNPSFPKQTNTFEGVGFHQYLNFGKFKPPQGEFRTYYDVANMGEYQYLKWLLSQRTAKRPKIKIRAHCFPHIEAAIQNENGQSKWEGRTITENGRAFKVYTALNEGGHHVEGPRIEMRHCKGCDKVKGAYVFTNFTNLCDVCGKSSKMEPGTFLQSVHENHDEEKQPIMEEKHEQNKTTSLNDEEYDSALRRSKHLKQNYKGFWHSDVQNNGTDS